MQPNLKLLSIPRGDCVVVDQPAVVDLANPLTAIALSAEAALRFLENDENAVLHVRAQLAEILVQVKIAHYVFEALVAADK
jgi:hypothetical protein